MHFEAKKITLIMDNFKTHTQDALYEAFVPGRSKEDMGQFDFVYTPKHASCFNMAVTEFHVLNKQCLSRHIATIDEIQREVCAWQENRHNKLATINWQFTSKEK